MIEFKHVSVEFNNGKNSVRAVNDVSFTIPDGEIFGIVGSSGAGKSTLMRTINGLEKPDKGEVLVDGKVVNQLSKGELRIVRGHIGMIFQHFNLITSRTVAENIAFPLKVAGKSKAEINKSVDNVLAMVDLEDKKNEYPEKLSGGQKQRVGIARALVNNTKVLLCDEPTSALDPETTNSILELLRKLSSEFGITVVIITHELSVVKSICTHAAVMDNGDLIEINDTYKLFTAPQQSFTRKLIASNEDFTLPESVIEEVKTSNQKAGNYWAILKLVYAGDSASDPVIANAAKKFDVGINVIHGKIEYIKQIPTGELHISIFGKHEEVKAAMDFIGNNVFHLEVLYEQQI
jgi:D-methionine transport system ATP-binding protein